MLQLEGMKRFLLALRKANCQSVFIDGSFVNIKFDLNDFDGTWDPAGVKRLLLKPSIRFHYKKQMQKEFSGEIYATDAIEKRSIKSFGEFFMADEDGIPKGFVCIFLDTVK